MTTRWLFLAPLILVAGCSRSHQPYPEPQPGQASGAANLVTPTSPSAANYPNSPAPLPGGSAEPVALPDSASEIAATPGAGFSIPSGTPVHVRLDSSIDTRVNRAGDGFTATLSQPIEVGGRVVVPTGTTFDGHVTTAAASGRYKGRAVLGLRLDSFSLHGRRYPVRTSSVDRVSASHKKRNAVLIGGGSALGAAIGAIAGGGKGALIGAGAGAGAGTVGAGVTGKKEVGIVAETPLRFTLRAPVDL
ncbi:MAG: hypothetical protein ABI759_12465 [Candidatus Solibacter sp.]